MNKEVMNNAELTAMEQEALQRKADTQKMVVRIREMSAARRPVTTEELAQSCELELAYAAELLAALPGSEDLEDIFVHEGKKQNYYYVYPTLAHNFVRLTALAEENDVANTVITIVRYNAKTYPRPTCGTDFAVAPFNYTLAQVQDAVCDLQKDPANADLQTYVSPQGNCYYYSTLHLSDKLATKLAEDREDLTYLF